MPEFILDHGTADAARTFNSLDTFTQGYVEAVFWLLDEEIKDATFADLAAEALATIKEDCRDFQSANAADLEAIDAHQAGVDFWLTRNRHGAGFWDRGHGDKGKRLTDASHAYGECNAYLGDDNQLYLG